MLRKEDLDKINETHQSLQDDIQTTRDQAKQIAVRLSSELEIAKMRAAIISDSLMDPMLSIDAEGRILSANLTVERIFGYVEADLLGKPITTIVNYPDLVQELIDEAHTYVDYLNENRPSDFSAYRDRYRKYLHTPQTKVLNKKFSVQCFTRDHEKIQAEMYVNILNVDCELSSNVVFLLYIHDNTEHMEVVDEVESLTQFQLSLLTALPNPVFYKDTQFRIIGANKAFEDFVEQSADKFIGKTNREFFDRSVAGELDLIDNSLKDASSPDVQIHKLHVHSPSMSDTREVMLYCTALRNTERAFKGTLATFVDLTDLMNLHRFKEALVASIPAPVYYLDRDLKYRDCNDRYAKLLGMHTSSILGRTREQVFPNSGDVVNGVIAQFYRQKDFEILTSQTAIQSYETQVYNVERKTFLDVVVYRSVLRTIDGKFDGIVAVVTDVSEIRAVQRFHQRVFDSLPLPVFYKDANLVYSACNELYAKWFGVTTSEVMGKTREQLFSYVKEAFARRGVQLQPDIEQQYKDMLQRYRFDEEAMLRAVTSDADYQKSNVIINEERVWNFELNQMRDVIFYRHAIVSNGVFEGVVCSMIDISELRKLEYLKKQQLDKVPVAVCYSDAGGNIISANSLYELLTGSKSGNVNDEKLAHYHNVKLEDNGSMYIEVYNNGKQRVEQMLVFVTDVDSYTLYIYFSKEDLTCLCLNQPQWVRL